MAAEEERRASAAAAEEEVVYKTKVVQFLGRSTPIILQNDNGPCPLLAICNVLLLRNYINLSLDASEVPLQKLLSLVAERLIDSNSNVQDKGDEYVSNQQQNIADAIDLLPRLATGIDVNLHFRKINDFEFTPECAIFDLLDIGLCHGWIVDPQDSDTTAAIGSKSYNTLVAELVAFETRKSEGERNQSIPEEDFVDFAAATTATLGVPSPSLSRVLSFDESPVSVTVGQKERRGDREEAEELTRALHLSATELCSSVDVSLTPEAVLTTSPNLDGSAHTRSFESTTQNVDLLSHIGDESEKLQKADQSSPPADGSSINYDADSLLTNVLLAENCSSSATAASARISDRLVAEGSGDDLDSNNLLPVVKTDLFIQKQLPSSEYIDRDESDVCSTSRDQTPVERTIPSQTSSDDIFLSTTDPKPTDDLPDFDLGISSHPSAPCADLNSSKEKQESVDVSDVCSSLEGSEPIYEGEECIIDSQLKNYEDREPVYEGEAVLAEQMDKTDPSSPGHSKDDDDKDQWKLIKNFLENNASQLTIYGLFCLQEGLKERELCVFFRNNHFSTMFKFNGELYLLATDQGYINQPDLVWEKLNEVNGDSVFMTGNFREFKAENHLNDSWNEQNAINSTAEYISSLGGSNPANSTLKSDLELAIALQQQEFEQQPQRQQVQNPQPSYVGGRSKLVTGPQASKNSHSSQKSESKKDKCIVM